MARERHRGRPEDRERHRPVGQVQEVGEDVAIAPLQPVGVEPDQPDPAIQVVVAQVDDRLALAVGPESLGVDDPTGRAVGRVVLGPAGRGRAILHDRLA